MALPLAYSGISVQERRKKARKFISEMGLEDRFTHRPTELSGGQNQRVAIARALVTKPSLILADEPTGNLDFENAEQIFQLLKALNQSENTSFVIVTHDLVLAARMDRQLKLAHGKLTPIAVPENILGMS